MAAKELWVEKYRPKTLTDYVFTDDRQKEIIEGWVNDKSIPHILVYGPAGTGKSSIAQVLINELGVDEYDVLKINASRENNVDTMRNKIEGFVSTMPFGAFKIVFLDEADFLSAGSQAILRGMMETYSSTARFILTCNYPHKIIPALHSRCQGFHIEKPDSTEFTTRAATVLVTEGIEFELDTLDIYVRATYPDLRKCLNSLQENSTTSLEIPGNNNTAIKDWKIEAVQNFLGGNIRKGREVICTQATIEDIDEIFRWMYDNLSLWSDTTEGQDEAILIIRDGLVKVPMCADQEINISACLVNLTQLRTR